MFFDGVVVWALHLRGKYVQRNVCRLQHLYLHSLDTVHASILQRAHAMQADEPFSQPNPRKRRKGKGQRVVLSPLDLFRRAQEILATDGTWLSDCRSTSARRLHTSNKPPLHSDDRTAQDGILQQSYPPAESAVSWPWKSVVVQGREGTACPPQPIMCVLTNSASTQPPYSG